MGDVIYHFTTLQTFVQIIKSGSLLLFDLTKSNDPLEGPFAANALKSSFISLYNNDEINKTQYEFCHSAWWEFSQALDSFSSLNEVNLAACFCSPEHELSLWRNYGDNGQGIAIGVGIEMLEHIAQQEQMRFGKVSYRSSQEMNDHARQFWLDHLNDENIAESLMQFYADGYFFKEKYHSDENEYRLIYSKEIASAYLLNNCEAQESLDAVAVKNIFKLCYGLDIQKRRLRGSQLINNILIGPQCNAAPPEISTFLRRHGITCFGIQESEIQMK